MTFILQAYEVFATGRVDPMNPMPSMPVVGDPAWVRSATYAIDAKTEGAQTPAMMRGPMMQSLLEDRFRLQTHRETREVPVYFMTIAKGGLRLQQTRQESCQPIVESGDVNARFDAIPCGEPRVSRKGSITVLDVRGVRLDAFSKGLHPDGRAVIDRTGLSGAYDIHLEFDSGAPASPDPDRGAASDPSPHSSLIVAMREQLGLRLDPGRGPCDFLVIDHIEKPASN